MKAAAHRSPDPSQDENGGFRSRNPLGVNDKAAGLREGEVLPRRSRPPLPWAMCLLIWAALAAIGWGLIALALHFM